MPGTAVADDAIRQLAGQAVGGLVLDRHDHGPPQDRRALLGEVPASDLQARLAVPRDQPGSAAQLTAW
jgi:hypothetical protein